MLRSSRCSSVACIALASLAACDDLVCTQDVDLVQIVAVTFAGVPVTGLTIWDTVLRTGHGFKVAQMDGIKPGGYIIFGDPYARELGRRKEIVKVTGRYPNGGFVAYYKFEADDCRIGKLAGPDTVIVTPWMAPD